MSKNTLPRLDALRNEMRKKGISAFIVPGTDPHLSEYSAEHWKARGWISGFNGSAGTAVITTDKAGLWTDSRYFLQAAQQLKDSGFDLFKDGLPETPAINDWLITELPAGSVIAVDGTLFSAAEARNMKQIFEDSELKFISDFTPFNTIWADRPKIPDNKLFIHNEKFSGESVDNKVNRVLEQVRKNKATSTLLAALDEIAWVFNVRGSDVECNPVVICYAFLSDTQRILFIDSQKLTEESTAYLKKEGITFRPYTDILPFLASLPEDTSILVDPKKVNYTLINTIPGHCIIRETTSPVSMLKSVKNPVQIEGIKTAMKRDGVALVRFFRWLEAHLSDGNVTEITVAEKLKEFRSAGKHYVGESFSTIAGFNEHGAIVHYSATPESNATLSTNGFLLIDSGAQYLDGTTDITRTIALGELTPEQKQDFTLVMKGHIALATAHYPQGTRGAQLDVLARHYLWNEGLNYLHGTGHGVGHFLNVHEGPQNIRLEENPTPLMPGMVTSNEPGLYRTGKYGIRCENLVLTVNDRETEFGRFYKFETLTLFPFDKKAFDKTLMTKEEIEWLNNYHETVYRTLSPELTNEEQEWLRNATSAL